MTPDIEFVNNEQRTPVVIIADVSGSVAGQPIAALNEGLQVLEHELKNDPVARNRVEVAIVTFGGTVHVVQDFTSAANFTSPTLTADGTTPMGAATHAALDLVAQRKQSYKEHGIDYTRPWVFLMTAGTPTDPYETTIERIHREEAARQIAFFAVGFGNVDMLTLTRIAPPTRPPLLLSGLKFKELFVWLSASQRRVSAQKAGQQQALPPTTGWAVSPT